jgi:DNA-binding NarL/FixJ family response regulator
MLCAASNEVRKVVILKNDRIYAASLERTVRGAFPRAEVLVGSQAGERCGDSGQAAISLLITGIGIGGGDVLEFLELGLREGRFERVLVVSARQEPRTLLGLRALPINGVFDSASEDPERLEHALRVVETGGFYWSASVLERLQQHAGPMHALCRMLSPVEQVVFATLGDGSDDEAAAAQLGLKASSVQSIRRSLHEKLGVRHKGELMRLAAQFGFVRFTPAGVVRPGFALLFAAYQARRRKRCW